MKKSEVLEIIDEVMNNREIDSIRNAILAIRDTVRIHRVIIAKQIKIIG